MLLFLFKLNGKNLINKKKIVFEHYFYTFFVTGTKTNFKDYLLIGNQFFLTKKILLTE